MHLPCVVEICTSPLFFPSTSSHAVCALQPVFLATNRVRFSCRQSTFTTITIIRDVYLMHVILACPRVERKSLNHLALNIHKSYRMNKRKESSAINAWLPS
ncbi:hypothetical protein BCR43DRAFT_492468 [Syncephalastrum racemosum]|uniref:Uncharacterized protein n=1 Tax=Syncephalastrum racemosum TaxID=13706 RepID=A0A1X2HDM0_SYNRA|nr:hypothetical protein BCR43DRAFT_492468 [Syncephalastrum racemosum]